MRIGKLSCHQLSERSIFINGVQFFVCTRCLGIYVGLLLAFLLAIGSKEFRRKDFHLQWFFLLLTPMALDGVTQLAGLRESTNFLRLFTGLLAGIGIGWLTAMILGKALANFGRFAQVEGAFPSPKTAGLTLAAGLAAFLLMMPLLGNASFAGGELVYWALTVACILSLLTIQAVVLLMVAELLFRPNYALERKINEIEGKEKR